MGRRKWTAVQKMEIVLAGMVPGANISAVCREYGIVQTRYYKWREAFIQGGMSAIKTGISNREQELEKELKKPKQSLAKRRSRLRFSEKIRTGAEGKDTGSGADPAQRGVFGPTNHDCPSH